MIIVSEVIQAKAEQICFETALSGSFSALQGAMASLFTVIGADPEKPQNLSRRLKINKNLAWKASRLVGASSPAIGIPHIPGQSGLDLLLEAFEQAGAGPGAVRAVREARQAFDRFVEVHAGDRATLDLMLDSMSAGWNSDRLEMSRRLAYQGNSGIWGLQTGVRYTFTMLAPSRSDPTRLDIGLIGAYIDCRRLRKGVTWPIFKIKAQHDCGGDYEVRADEAPCEDSLPLGRTGLLSGFCSPTMPEIRAVRDQDQLVYELGEGPVGNTGRFDCFFGTFMPALATRFKTPRDPSGRVYSNISVPAERLIFDVLVHRDLPYAGDPVAAVYSGLSDKFNPAAPQPLERALPIHEPFERLSAASAEFLSPRIPRHAEVLRCMLDAGKWNPEEFTAVRLNMQFPPLPSFVVIEFPLGDAPERA